MQLNRVSCDMTVFFLLFTFLMVIRKANCLQKCDYPSQKGNFSFLAQPWPVAGPTNLLKVPKYSSVVVNCTTNIKNASVWLELIDPTTNRWKDYREFSKRDQMEQLGQLFVIKKVQNTGQFFSCRGKWNNDDICLYKGFFIVTEFTDANIEIYASESPLYGTIGEWLKFYCEARGPGGKTESYLSWYKKTPSGEIAVDKSLTSRENFNHNGIPYDKEAIILKSAKLSDSGVYICKRKSPFQTNEKTREVEVIIRNPTRPVVILNPPDREVQVRNGENRQIKIICQYASGSPKPKKEWKDPRGKIVHRCDSHSDTCTLIINKPTYEQHHGRYTCTATSSGGTSSVNVMINVLLKVELEKLITKEVASYEEAAALSCRVKKANPNPTMVWYFQSWSCATVSCKPDDQDWTRNFPKVSVTPPSNIPTNESRLIVPASRTNAFYSCHATNGIGTDVFNVTLHRLASPPVIFKLSQSPGDINENSTFILNCSASVNFYKDIRWVKNGASVKEDPGRVMIMTVYRDFLRVLVIKFKRIALDDSGKYTCNTVMRNGTEKSLTNDVFVRAIKSPTIYGFENHTLNQTKGNAVLFCNASGNPLPSVKWKFRGSEVVGDGIIREVEDCSTRKQGRYFIDLSGRRQLVICDMDYKKHQGIYQCIAENNLGTMESMMRIKIVSRPNIIRWDKKVMYLPDSPIRLFCEADGNPAPNVTITRIVDGKYEELKNLKKYGNGSVYVSFIVNEKTDRRYACIAENSAGRIVEDSRLSEQGYSTYTRTKPVSSTIIAIIIVVCILFIIFVLLAVFWYKRRLEKKYAPYLKPNKYFEFDPNRTLFEQSSELPYDPDWEFPRDRLNFVKMIGSGAFGEVWLAEAEGILTLDPRDKTSIAAKRRSKIKRSQRYTHLYTKERKKAQLPESSGEKTFVAVKTLKGDASDAEYKDLASELKILIHIGENKQIVNLLGACTRGGKLCVVLEYCPHGSLLNFLRDRRDIYRPVWFKNEPDMSSELTNMDLTMIAYQIAKGLDFLSSKRCVHRDVAARNVLVGVDYIVKVADFGLARDIYKDEFYMKSTSGLLPVKWMAPESLFDKIYTSQSDVWSFGIVMWEIFTLGGSPYPGLPTEDLFNFLEQGRRMEQPELCPLEFYAIMNDCWEKNPNDRPLFSQLVDRIAQITSNRSGQDNPYLEMDRHDGPEQPVNSDYLEPIITRTQPRDGYLPCNQSDKGVTNDRESIRKSDMDHNVPSYLNDDTVRMSLLEGYNDGTHDYTNTRQFDDLNEFTV